MRRESSTVVALVGEVDEALLAGLGRAANVSVARAPASPAGPPAKPGAARPRRIAVAGMATGLSAQLSRLQDTLGSLEYGPWWPPLGDLLDTARRFYAGALTETQPARG